MKISIVIATYNGEKYILEQLESILKQTRKPDEVLICDDCSTDSTIRIISDFISKNCLQNWKLISNKSNKGWRRNFWDGILSASGDCIFLCDQDDIWNNRKVELMSHLMEDKADIELLASGYIKFFSNGKKEPMNESGKVIRQALYDNIFNILLPGCTYCVKRKLVNRLSSYWTPDTAHDEILWRYALFSGTLYIYQKNLIWWRKHADSAWSVQGQQAKDIDKRVQWTKFANEQLTLLEKYLVENHQDSGINLKIIHNNKRWISDRQYFYMNRKISTAVKLLSEVKYYNSFKQYLGDLYITLMKK